MINSHAGLLLLGADIHRQGNNVEALVWWLIALALAYFAFRQTGAARRRCWIGAATFFAFGLSDIVEAGTGAWWRPWWLLVWKAACVAVMLWLLISDWRARKKPTKPHEHDSVGQ